MNIKLLRQIQREIRDEPRRLDMDVPIRVSDDKAWYLPPCGTTACIAGFAVLGRISSKTEIKSKALEIIRKNRHPYIPNMPTWPSITNSAMHLLKLTSSQAEILFFVHNWPKRYQRYNEPTDAKARARIACARISHFIKTKGRS